VAGVDLPTLELEAVRQLAADPNWVCWKAVPSTGKDGSQTVVKVPINPHTGKKALTNVEPTWGTYQQACQRFVTSDDLEGVGYVITESGLYTGIDIDKHKPADRDVLDAQGRPCEWVQKIIDELSSYTEISPSGNGVHIWVKGKPPGRSKQTAQISIYERLRYFTFTGNHLAGTPERIEFREQQLSKIYYTLLNSAPRKSPDTTPAVVASDPRFSKLIDDIGPFMKADAVAPEKIEVLFENNTEAKRLWSRERLKTAEESWSQSEWDLALANHMLDVGWLPVEIMRALIENRRLHNGVQKLRADYYARTMIAAQRGRERENALKALQDMSDVPEEKRRGHILDKLEAAFGVRVTRIIKFLGDPPSYRIVTDKGSSSGDIKMLSHQAAFRDALMMAAGVVLAPFKPGKWNEIVQILLNACEEEFINDEMTDAGQAFAWVQAYLDDRPKPNGKAWIEAAMAGNPYIVGTSLRIMSRDFSKFLRMSMYATITARKLSTMMRDLGARSSVQAYDTSEGRRTSNSVWELPQQFYYSIVEKQEEKE